MNSFKRNKIIKISSAIITIICSENLAQKRKRKRKWIRSWLARRDLKGCYHNLITELRLEDPERYRRYLRMSTDTFYELLCMVEKHISRQDTKMRKCIPPDQRLAVTLRYLATGETQSSLETQFRIAQNTISGIIIDVCHCQALYKVLQPLYMKVPESVEQWENNAVNFDQLWNFPNCLGAIDGKHVIVMPPSRSGSFFYNYKGSHSIVLMAIVDSQYRFLYVDVGMNGRISDGGVFDRSQIKLAIENNLLNIPEPKELPFTNNVVPYVLLGDDAFQLTNYLMKPYSGYDLTDEQIIFNYRLSRGRRISENAFGILTNKFQIYAKPIRSEPVRVVDIVLATCALHNYLRTKNIENNCEYVEPGYLDYEDTVNGKLVRGSWRSDTSSSGMANFRLSIQRHTRSAAENRNIYKEYFNTVGQVEWQRRMCLLH